MFEAILILTLLFLLVLAGAFLTNAWQLGRRLFWRELKRLTLFLVGWWAGMVLLLAGGIAFGESLSRDNIGFAIMTLLVVALLGLGGTTVFLFRAIDRLERIKPDPLTCAACGYNLGGLPNDRPCPECGEPRA